MKANLGEISNCHLKEKHFISFTDKDTKVAETFARESSALDRHLLWLTDLLLALNSKIEDPSTWPIIQPFISQVLEHQRWLQALLSDSLIILTTNTMLVQQDLAISSLAG